MQDDLKRDPFADALVLEDRISLSVARLERIPDDGDLAHWDRRNADVLQALLALDEGSRLGDDAGDAVAQELLRLERKLDLVLDLLGDVLGTQLAGGTPVPVRLSERGLQWPMAEGLPMAGSLLRLDLRLQPRYPVPLRVCAQVVETPSEAGRAEARCTVGFLGMSESTRETLAKLIFRAHRRSIGRRREEPR